MRRELTTSLIAIVVFTVLLGLAYPLLTTAVSQVAFPHAADGSRVARDGRTVGSRLIGQSFTGVAYFRGRPSATKYDASYTFFNNLGPNDKALAASIGKLATAYSRREHVPRGRVPVDAVTTSASGVDPHISTDNAEIQAVRVARVRRLPLARVRALVSDNTHGRGLGVFGQPGVNVLMLNLALDREGSR